MTPRSSDRVSGVPESRCGTATGRVVATATQQGGTGDTERIMVDPVTRGETIYDTPGAAGVTLDLDLERPTELEFIGEGPLEFEESMARAMKRMLVVPGEDILGDGIVLDLHGFIVEWVEPATLAAGVDASVVARVRMLCGCPHTPGGLWDADRIDVTARVYDGGRLVRSASLRYAGEPNLFSGTVSLSEGPAGAELVILVTDADRANFGMSRPRPIR